MRRRDSVTNDKPLYYHLLFLIFESYNFLVNFYLVD